MVASILSGRIMKNEVNACQLFGLAFYHVLTSLSKESECGRYVDSSKFLQDFRSLHTILVSYQNKGKALLSKFHPRRFFWLLVCYPGSVTAFSNKLGIYYYLNYWPDLCCYCHNGSVIVFSSLLQGSIDLVW